MLVRQQCNLLKESFMTEKLKKILVALDFSDHTKQTFDYAVGLADSFGAELIIGSIISHRDVESVGLISSMGYEVDGEHYIKEVKAQRRAELEKILETSPYTQDHIRLIFKVGHPVEQLLRMIIQEKADLMVMGIKGRSNTNTVMIGSVAEKLFRKSPVPVISFRDPESAQRLKKRIKID